MNARTRFRAGPTEGQRARLIAFFLVALFGMIMGYLAVLRFNDGTALAGGLNWYETWIVVAAGLGGVSALWLAGDRVGQHGPRTTPRVLAGLIWVSLVGAIIAGTLALPVYGTMFAPFTLVVTLMTSPLVVLFWTACMGAVHMCMVTYRSERDSVFTPNRLTPPDCPDSLPLRVRGHFG